MKAIMKYRFYIFIGVTLLVSGILVSYSISSEQNLLLDAKSSLNICSKEKTEGRNLFLKVMKDISTSIDQEIVRVMFKDENRHAEKLWIEFFGECLVVTKTRVVIRGPSDYTWFGKIDGDPSSNVLFTVGGQVMFGRIEYSGSLYSIEPIGDGLFHRIIKLDTTKSVPFGDDSLLP